MREAEHQRRALLEHAVDLPEDAVEVLHEAEGVGAEHEVDRLATHEGEVGELAMVQLDLDALAVGEALGERELLGREVDADGDGALLGERDRALRTTATQLEDALAAQVAEQPEVGLVVDVWAVAGDVGGQLRARLVAGGVAIPGGRIVGGPVPDLGAARMSGWGLASAS